jgi:hypothetical protein
VQHLRFFVEDPANAVAAEFAHHAEAVALGKFLDGKADVTQARRA